MIDSFRFQSLRVRCALGISLVVLAVNACFFLVAAVYVSIRKLEALIPFGFSWPRLVAGGQPQRLARYSCRPVLVKPFLANQLDKANQ